MKDLSLSPDIIQMVRETFPTQLRGSRHEISQWDVARMVGHAEVIEFLELHLKRLQEGDPDVSA